MTETLTERAERLKREQPSGVIDVAAGEIPVAERRAKLSARVIELKKQAKALGASKEDIQAAARESSRGVPPGVTQGRVSPEETPDTGEPQVDPEEPSIPFSPTKPSDIGQDTDLDEIPVFEETQDPESEIPIVDSTLPPAPKATDVLPVEKGSEDFRSPQVKPKTSNETEYDKNIDLDDPTSEYDKALAVMAELDEEGTTSPAAPIRVIDLEMPTEDMSYEEQVVFLNGVTEEREDHNRYIREVTYIGEKSYTPEADVKHMFKEVYFGGAGFLDLIVDIPSFASNLRPDEDSKYHSRILQGVGVALADIGDGAQWLIDNGYTFTDLAEYVAPFEKTKVDEDGRPLGITAFGYWGGVFTRGAGESAAFGFALLAHANKLKKLSKGKEAEMLKDIPGFLKPMYKELANNPSRALSREFWSGAFANLSGTKATEFWIKNEGDPRYAPIIFLISAMGGGTIQSPTKIPLPAVVVAKKVLPMIKRLGEGSSKIIHRVTGKVKSLSEDGLDEAFNDKVFADTVDLAHGNPKGQTRDEVAAQIIEEMEKNPNIAKVINGLMEDIGSHDEMRTSIEKALKARKAIADDGGSDIQFSAGTVSDVGEARGLGKTLAQDDATRALKEHRETTRVINEWYQKVFEKGSPEDQREAAKMSEQAYHKLVRDRKVATLAQERALNDVHTARGQSSIARGKAFRAQLKSINTALKQIATSMYESIDPMNTSEMAANKFTVITKAIEDTVLHPARFTSRTIEEAQKRLQPIYGQALARTLSKKMEAGILPAKSISRKTLDSLSSGDLSVINGTSNIPKKHKKIFYQDAEEMLRDLDKLADNVADSTKKEGGEAKAFILELRKNANIEYDINLRAQGQAIIANKRELARDFYSTYLGGYFDPSATAGGELLKRKSYAHLSVKDSRVFAQFSEDVDNMSEFMRLTDPADPEGGLALIDLSSTRFGKYVKSLNIDPKDQAQAAEDLAGLRVAMESHLTREGDRVLEVNPEAPREAYRKWLKEREDILDQMPELHQSLTDRLATGDPAVGNKRLRDAQEQRWIAEQELERLKVANLLGPGPFHSNVKAMLNDADAVAHLDEVLKSVDTDGKMRRTIINAAIQDAVKVNGQGIIDSDSILKLLKESDGLRVLAPAGVMERLENLYTGARIIERGDIKPGDFDLTFEASASPEMEFALRNVGKVFTNLRSAEVMGVRTSRLFLLQAGGEATKMFGGLDVASKAKLQRIYLDVISDPESFNKIAEASARFANAANSDELASAALRLRNMYDQRGTGEKVPGMLGLPTGGAIGVASTGAKATEEKVESAAEGEPQ